MIMYESVNSVRNRVIVKCFATGEMAAKIIQDQQKQAALLTE